MTEKNVIACVQARMGSTRLPGKVLRDIEGKPMLWHVVNRIKCSLSVSSTVVLTSLNAQDDEIERFCLKNNIKIYRGKEEDVLDRYYQAARYYKAEAIIRITGDCPLIDPQIVDKVIFAYSSAHDVIDGASNVIRRTYPRGLDTEVVSFAALERCWRKADKDCYREHVTLYMYEHPELFSLVSVENNKDLSNLRWTVDEEADLILIRKIYNRLYEHKKSFLMDDVINLLKREPSLSAINLSVRQKSAKP